IESGEDANRNSYAAHTAPAGGGRATSLASRRRFCAIAASVNSSCAPRGPRNRRRLNLRMRLRWANSISTRLRSRRDCSKAFSVNECTGGIASIFIDAARDFALRRFWAAFGFQRTRRTIRGPRAIEENIAIVDLACRVQKLALRAYIDVAI